MTEKIATRPGMKLAKIGALIAAGTLVLAVALAVVTPGTWSPSLLFVLVVAGVLVGGALVVVGFIKRLFAALENR